ncbi:MAG: BON domain-containing protein [Armatimonadota bacterium]
MEGEYNSSQMGPSQASVFRSSDQIMNDIKEMITQNNLIHPKNIDVALENGIVTLSGKVDNETACEEAENAVREVIGVINVVNKLEIR